MRNEIINLGGVPRISRRPLGVMAAIASIFLALSLVVWAGQNPLNAPNLQAFPDPTGTVRTFNTNGAIDSTNPFFQSLGINERSCGSCHVASDGMTVSAAHVQQRFDATDGLDPIFRLVDGATCPTDTVTTLDDRRTAYALLHTKGLIRILLAVPSGAEFSVTGISDPYGCPDVGPGQLAMFRRPLPATNLGFLSTIMWDGRESSAPGRRPLVNLATFLSDLQFDLTQQAIDATTGHAQGSPPSPQELAQIVAFELGLSTAQATDNSAGELDAQGAQGGPVFLSRQPFFLGINDSLGGNPTGAAFNPSAMTLFQPWQDLHSSETDPYTTARESVARGEVLFNTFSIPISGVAGINDTLGVAVVPGTCTSCHDTPNVGNHSLSVPLNIGKTKGPILRSLAARAPYFHNGSAATLLDVVNFYVNRFGLIMTDHQKSDLVAFLQSL